MTNGNRPRLEICVDSTAGVAAAIGGGADRIELCSALPLGGLTPSAGLVDRALAACAGTGVAVRAMVRPRDGDFAYDADDLSVAIAEGRALAAQGADGLVFGAARDGRLDEAVADRWIKAVRDGAGRAVPCTFHRAIDALDDPVAAVRRIAALGYDRILTSGGASTAIAGAATIRAMVECAGGAVVVMPGSGVTPATLLDLARATGATEFHASASRPDAARTGRVVDLGFVRADARTTDRATVGSLRAQLDAIGPTGRRT